MECEICGGTDFYKESGYFYCNECQTQSQEVREHEFDIEINATTHGTKKIKNKQEKTDKKITSWECYNFVLCTLTNQLINLGAKKKLKSVVKCLWLRYLEKLEVLDLKLDRRPKVQLVSSRRDITILYGGETKKRKRRKSDSDLSVTTTDSKSIRKQRTKKKQALVQAHYEEFSQKSSQEVASLHNETLTSLKSSSEKSINEPISFNRYSLDELQKRTSQSHFEEHKLDYEQKLECHKLTYKNCSQKFFSKHDFYILSPIKLYCILYLGLLINKDKIQLGDLFRFIREGHINLNNYAELFPEEYSDKFLNIQNTGKINFFSNKHFRVVSAKLAKNLEVAKFIEVPDLEELCHRYCEEMNLPEDIFIAAKNLISRTRPELNFTRNDEIIPNYEGKTMSIILFTIKLLFGLDGITEYHLSKYAQRINKLDINKPKMFDIGNWMEYIGYRKLVMAENHFPSSYKNDSENINSTLFLQYMKSLNKREEESVKLSKESKDYEKLLTKVRDLQDDETVDVNFPPCLTPFLEYSKILSSTRTNNFEDILKISYGDNSLEFLLRPKKYLQLISDTVRSVHGGANDNWVIEHMETFFKTQNHNLDVSPVELTTNGCEKLENGGLYVEKKFVNMPKNPTDVKRDYEQLRRDIFKKNEKFIREVSDMVNLDTTSSNGTNKKICYTYFIPYERYWLFLLMTADSMGRSNWEKYFSKYPFTFRLIFKECARIIEQSYQEFILEFNFSELFLLYSTNYCDKNYKPMSKKHLDQKLNRYVNKAETYW